MLLDCHEPVIMVFVAAALVTVESVCLILGTAQICTDLTNLFIFFALTQRELVVFKAIGMDFYKLVLGYDYIKIVFPICIELSLHHF